MVVFLSSKSFYDLFSVLFRFSLCSSVCLNVSLRLSLFPATVCTFILLSYSFVIAEFYTLVLSFVSPKPLVLYSLCQPQHTSTCTPSSQTDLVCLQSQSPKTACWTQCPFTYGVRMQGCVYVCVVWKNVLRLPETLSFTTEKKKTAVMWYYRPHGFKTSQSAIALWPRLLWLTLNQD